MKIKIPYWPLLLGPTLLLYLGALINWVAIGANHGYMPVQGAIECAKQKSEIAQIFGQQEEVETDNVHVCMTKDTRLKILCDWLLLPGIGTASPGDILEFAYDKFFFPFLYMWIALMVAGANKKDEQCLLDSLNTKKSTFPRSTRYAKQTRWYR